MKMLQVWKRLGVWVLLTMVWGCGANRSYLPRAGEFIPPETAVTQDRQQRGVAVFRQNASRTSDAGWTERRVSEAELLRLNEKDPDLSPSAKLAILARLNTRAKYYIDEDVKSGRSLKVPNDFNAFRHWTPLPKYIPEVASVPKFVLVVKQIPFIGWYERGRLVGDAYICIGKQGDWTRAGIYKVLDKDVDHISRSYTNAYGRPAPMPWALRIYEHVWIHAGDITGGYCSHGCVNLPLASAVSLFDWADFKTAVVVVESMGELRTIFEKNQSNCRLYAHKCDQRQTTVD